MLKTVHNVFTSAQSGSGQFYACKLIYFTRISCFELHLFNGGWFHNFYIPLISNVFIIVDHLFRGQISCPPAAWLFQVQQLLPWISQCNLLQWRLQKPETKVTIVSLDCHVPGSLIGTVEQDCHSSNSSDAFGQGSRWHLSCMNLGISFPYEIIVYSVLKHNNTSRKHTISW